MDGPLEDLLISSDDEDYDIMMPPLREILLEDDNENGLAYQIYPIHGIVRRIPHIKVINYIENIVRNYIAKDFVMHFRLSRDIAYDLINKFEASDIFIRIPNNAGIVKINAEKHILCYLWFVGHESISYRDVADRFGITISALYSVITRVTQFIMTLAPNIIRYPTPAEKEESTRYFLEEKGFPDVIGSVHDARVFQNSSIYTDLRQLCEDNYILLGDSAYPCLSQLIVPYKDNGHLTRRQRTFNQKLSSSRVIIENAFGCLKQRFRQLYHFKLRNIVRMVHVIHACCVLHNIANREDVLLFEDAIDDEEPDIEAQNQPIIYDIPRDNETNSRKRDEICLQIT